MVAGLVSVSAREGISFIFIKSKSGGFVIDFNTPPKSHEALKGSSCVACL